jgi:hypothetical protein
MLNNIAAVNGVPVKIVVTGGTLTSDVTYYYRTFLANGTLGITGASLTADILVVAGGGGSSDSPGGGAGGLLGFNTQSLLVANHSVTVGAGGAVGAQGVDSQFASLTLVKGGGYGRNGTGINGGSGSGGGAPGGIGVVGGNGTAGQGNNGGSAVGFALAGGGGGASAVGSNPTGSLGGIGGDGSTAYSSWGSVIGKGQNVSGTYYFAGGGTGGGNSSFQRGGYGGGGASAAAGTSGTANTGGGAGGNWNLTAVGQGGSGIVVVRYTKVQVD